MCAGHFGRPLRGGAQLAQSETSRATERPKKRRSACQAEVLDAMFKGASIERFGVRTNNQGCRIATRGRLKLRRRGSRLVPTYCGVDNAWTNAYATIGMAITT